MVSRIADIPLGTVAVAAVATWRLTYALWNEDGPARIFARLRARAAQAHLGHAFDCFYCLSLWVALALAPFVSDSIWGAAMTWPALSGAAILLERISVRADTGARAAVWSEITPTAAEPHTDDRTGDAS